jgi:hypothetical protein
MEKSIFLKTNIHKKSLERGLYIVNPSFVNTARDTAISFSLDRKFFHHSSLQKSDAFFQWLDREKKASPLLFLFHS